MKTLRNRRWSWAIVALCVLQLGVPAAAQDSWFISEELNHSRDYILPSEVLQVDRLVAGAPAERSIAGVPADGSMVSYTAFNGIPYSLVQYNGRYVAFLVQPASLALGRFTVPELRVFIDRFDILYQHFAEMMGGEPRGSTPLLQMAFVDTPGASGRGYIGVKGIEINSNMLDPAQPEYIYSVGIHELTHNFDFFSSFVMHGRDPMHAWSTFMQFSTNFYMLEGSPLDGYFEDEDSSAEFLQRQVGSFFDPYINFPDSSWTACVRDNACNNIATAAQGGMALRMGQLHGSAGIKAAIGYLRNSVVRRRLVAGQMTILQKNDLLLESLAYGSRADVSCYMDSWKWPISPGLRSQLAGAFGPNATCADQDGDGFSPLHGDQDDLNPATYPGVEVLLEEITDYPNSFPGKAVPFPVRIRGVLAGMQDIDFFQVVLPQESVVRFKLNRINPFQGGLHVLRQESTWQPLKSSLISGSGTQFEVLLAAGSWTFLVAAAISNQGEYELLVSPVVSPSPLWPRSLGAPPASESSGSGLTLRTPPLPRELERFADLSARFWVEGYGWAGIKNLDTSGGAALEWSPTTRFNHCGASYRVQFMTGDLPVSPISQPGAMPVQPECPSVTAQPVATIAGVVNAASFRAGERLSPGSIASLFGSNLGSIEQLSGFPAISMDGISVSFDGILAPLFHLVGSQGQINLQVPTALPESGNVTVVVRTPAGASANFTVAMGPAAPGIFYIPSSTNPNRRNAAALFANTSWIVMPGSMAQTMGLPNNCRASGADPVAYCGEPARPGDDISVYVTGLGKATRGGVASETILPTGLTAPADGNPLYRTVLQPTVTIGGVPAIVSYSGAAPGFAGLYQINLRIPAGAPASDEVPLTVAMPDAATFGNATLAIRARQ